MNFKWFKNLHVFCLQQPFTFPADVLKNKLTPLAFRPCGQFEWSTMGWISPFIQMDGTLVYKSGDCLLLTARKQEKILPASVIRDFVKAKVAQIETEQSRKVRKREKEEIKAQIIEQLLPLALPRHAETSAYIDTAHHWLVVDSASHKKAEDMASLLRKSLEAFPAIPPAFPRSMMQIMTQWLVTQTLPEPFAFGEDCKLIAGEGESVTCKQLNLLSPEVKEHLNAGKSVHSLALRWQERLEFVLDIEFTIKRIKFLDIVQEEREEVALGTDFTLMTLEVAKLVNQLFTVFGGVLKQ